MIGFIRTVFFIIVVYYLIRFVTRVLLPYFRAVTEINERQKTDGERTYIQHIDPKAGRASRSTPDGDYVDYKEVE